MTTLELITSIRERVTTLDYLEYERPDSRAACEQILFLIDKYLNNGGS